MKNIIEKILRNKVLRILIPAVLILAIIVLVLQMTFMGEEKTTEESFFTEYDYPAEVVTDKKGLHIKLDGSESPELSWEIVSDEEHITVDKVGKEVDGKLELLVKPKEAGYANISCKRSGKVGELDYTAVDFTISVLVSSDENKLTASISDMYQTSSEAGALDSETPFLIDGMWVIFPNGGNWEIFPENEEKLPEGLYSVTFTTNDAGYRCAIVTFDPPEELVGDFEQLEKIISSRLIIRNTDIGYEKHLSCAVGADGAMCLNVED